jgi:serine/threonine protein kinase
MKILNKERIFGNKHIESNLVRYAYTERNILCSIQHPFIVQLNFAFQTPEKLALVMDYCAGGDLGHQLAKDKKFTENKARFYICEILLALEELHKHGIIFRDLKPENVVLDSQGHAHLTDFGLSKEGIYGTQITKSFCGSVAYLAPEMLRRKGHDKSVDWYLLGVLLYEMLTGIPPYYSINREQLFYNIQRGKLHMPRYVSEPAKNLISKLLHRDPKKRLGYARDSDELKEHIFFQDINWHGILRKEGAAPSFDMPKPIRGRVSLEKIFSCSSKLLELGTLKGWSFIDTRRMGTDVYFN